MPQHIAWTKSADNQVNPYREGKEKHEIEIERIQVRPAENPPVVRAGYQQASVAAMWNNHFGAFDSQDVGQIALDYTAQSVVQVFDHTAGTLKTAEGIGQIAQLYAELFATMSDVAGMAGDYIDIMEGTTTLDGSVYRAWKCPSSGITSATDTVIFSSDNRVIRHTIVIASDATFAPTTTLQPMTTTLQPMTTTPKPTGR